jgi:hypothetical protein
MMTEQEFLAMDQPISMGDPLQCAACDHDCTHPTHIETFAEQADGKPSLRVMLECEQCSSLTAVELTRHEGRTFLNTAAWFTEPETAF